MEKPQTKMVRIQTQIKTRFEYYITPDQGAFMYNPYKKEYKKPILSNYRTYLKFMIGSKNHGTINESHKIHVEVANAFVQPRNLFCTQVHHLDMDKTNNVANNLIWVTPSEHHYIHNQARRGEYTTMMQVLEEEREFCRENGIRFERKIDINLLTSKIKKYYESKSRTVSHGK